MMNVNVFEKKKQYSVEKAAKCQDEPTPRELWEDLGSYSTLHGFHFTFNGFSRVRRTVWILLLLGAGYFLANQIYNNLLKVMAYQVVLKYRTEMKGSLDFPAVSLCNNNMFRKTRIKGTFAQRYLDLLDPVKSDQWAELESGLNYSMDMESAARQYGHNLTEMMNNGKCHWPGRTCNERNFTTFYEMKYGQCYTFNSGNGQEITKAASTGVSRGFTVILDTQPDEYYGPYSYEGTGFRVMIEDQNVKQRIGSHSLQISPGFAVEMRIARKERNNLEPPYLTRCTKKEGYSTSLCEKECYSDFIVKWCRCRVLGATGLKSINAPWCSPWQIKQCVSKALDWFAEANLQTCNCPTQCHQIEYDVTTSFMAFPSNSYWETLYANKSLTFPRKLEDLENFRKRHVKLNVFYGKLDNHITSEVPAYTLIDLGNDLGGSLGLFVGCSVLTVFEFVDVFVLMCLSHWRRKRRADSEA